MDASTTTEPVIDDITVESNGPLADTPAPEAAPVVGQTAASADPGDEDPDPHTETTEQPKPKRDSIQARIDKSVAAQRQAERERDELRARLDSLERQPRRDEPRQPAAPQAPKYYTGPPPSEDEIGSKFKDYPEFIRETARWQVAEERAADAMQARQRATYERHEATATKFAERIQKAEQTDPEFWSKISPDIANLTPSSALGPGERRTVYHAIADLIFDSEYSTELMAHLSANRTDFQRLSTLPPHHLAREMGRLEARISGPPAAHSGPAAKPVSQAPPPIKPVGTAASIGDRDPFTEDLDMDEHIRLANARDQKTGRFTRRR